MSLGPVAGRDEMAGVGKNRGTLSQKLNINQQAWFSKIQPKDVIRSQTNIMGSHIIPSVDKGMGYRSLTAKAVHTLILWLGELRVYLSQYVRCLVYHCTCNMRDGKTYMHIYIYSIYIVYIYMHLIVSCYATRARAVMIRNRRTGRHPTRALPCGRADGKYLSMAFFFLTFNGQLTISRDPTHHECSPTKKCHVANRLT